MSLTQGKVSMPCASRLGIVSALEGVYFPTKDGLILVAAGGMQNVTNMVIGKDEWTSEYEVEGIKAMAEIAAADVAIRKRTEKLRALRLAKEAEDLANPPEPKVKPKAKAKAKVAKKADVK
jgi:hypothetical protein